MQLRDDDLVDILKVDAGGQALLGAEQDAVPGLLQRLPQRPPLGEGGGGAGDLDQGPVRQELLDCLRVGIQYDLVPDTNGDDLILPLGGQFHSFSDLDRDVAALVLC